MPPQRIQLRRTKGWRLPENTVVVARPHKWGNPYRIGDDVPGLQGAKMDREDVVHWHRIAMLKASGETIEQIRTALRGKNLACWCPLDCACHADTLLEIANT
ncbi:MAG: DUF4326 domain-containing protein [Verrucomicrobia bacterium]|nr:DUF4326 domain-containing protein [Verrucomicrobiota bacterium]